MLTAEHGEFEVLIGVESAPPVRLHLSVKQLILDGSRWEADLGELAQDGYSLNSSWQCADAFRPGVQVHMDPEGWLVWSVLHEPQQVVDVARRLCLPDLETTNAVKRLHRDRLLVQVSETSKLT